TVRKNALSHGMKQIAIGTPPQQWAREAWGPYRLLGSDGALAITCCTMTIHAQTLIVHCTSCNSRTTERQRIVVKAAGTGRSPNHLRLWPRSGNNDQQRGH